MKDWLFACRGVASRYGGVCCSETCTGRDHRVDWQCKSGHIWRTTFRTAEKSWCPYCSGRKLSIEDAKGNKYYVGIEPQFRIPSYTALYTDAVRERVYRLMKNDIDSLKYDFEGMVEVNGPFMHKE